MSIEEVETLNPHLKWSRQKVRREVSRRARKLRFGSYAFGCRGHPGKIVAKNFHPSDPYGSDVEIESLIDGNVEGCSIFYCNPDPISEEFAIEFAEFAKSHSVKMATIKFFPEAYPRWEEFYNDPDYTDSYKSQCSTLMEYLGLNEEEFALYKEIKDSLDVQV